MAFLFNSLDWLTDHLALICSLAWLSVALRSDFCCEHLMAILEFLTFLV